MTWQAVQVILSALDSLVAILQARDGQLDIFSQERLTKQLSLPGLRRSPLVYL